MKHVVVGIALSVSLAAAGCVGQTAAVGDPISDDEQADVSQPDAGVDAAQGGPVIPPLCRPCEPCDDNCR